MRDAGKVEDGGDSDCASRQTPTAPAEAITVACACALRREIATDVDGTVAATPHAKVDATNAEETAGEDEDEDEDGECTTGAVRRNGTGELGGVLTGDAMAGDRMPGSKESRDQSGARAHLGQVLSSGEMHKDDRGMERRALRAHRSSSRDPEPAAFAHVISSPAVPHAAGNPSS